MKIYCQHTDQIGHVMKEISAALHHQMVEDSEGRMMRLEISIEPCSGPSRKQFNALHQWCGEVAEVLNACGMDQRTVLKPGVEIPWDKRSVKEMIWKPIQEARTGKSSTKEPRKTEYPDIYETLVRHFGDKFGVVLPPWPQRRDDL